MDLKAYAFSLQQPFLGGRGGGEVYITKIIFQLNHQTERYIFAQAEPV